MEHLATCKNGDVVSTTRQTAGTGRFQRAWVMPDNRGLALSAILTVVDNSRMISAITQLGALAVQDAMSDFGIESMLKWPNDVLVGGRKISGILAERDTATGVVVLGIGLNVNASVDDLKLAGLQNIATSMRMEHGRDFHLGEVLDELVASLQRSIDMALLKGTSWVPDAWSCRDWLAGSMVEVSAADRTFRGTYEGTDHMGRLILGTEDGARHVLHTGDVTRLRGAK